MVREYDKLTVLEQQAVSYYAFQLAQTVVTRHRRQLVEILEENLIRNQSTKSDGKIKEIVRYFLKEKFGEKTQPPPLNSRVRRVLNRAHLLT